MEYLHRVIDAGPDDILEVTLDHPANVQLLDQENFERYKQGQAYRYFGGGYVQTSPFRLRVPFKGRWHVVVDLGGGAGTVKAAVTTSGSLTS
jgi:hypothetical protein